MKKIILVVTIWYFSLLFFAELGYLLYPINKEISNVAWTIGDFIEINICNKVEYLKSLRYFQSEEYNQVILILTKTSNNLLECNKAEKFFLLASAYFFKGYRHTFDKEINANEVIENWENSLMFFKKSFAIKQSQKTQKNIEIVQRNIEKLKNKAQIINVPKNEPQNKENRSEKDIKKMREINKNAQQKRIEKQNYEGKNNDAERKTFTPLW